MKPYVHARVGKDDRALLDRLKDATGRSESDLVRRGLRRYLEMTASELLAYQPDDHTVMVDGDSVRRRTLLVAIGRHPGDEVSGRSLDLLCHQRLRVVNEAADVAPFYVAHHHDPAQ